MLTGSKNYKSKAKLASDTKRTVRIHLYDDGQETKGATGAIDLDGVLDDSQYRKYNVLEFGHFLSRRIFRSTIWDDNS